jgi:urea transporter
MSPKALSLLNSGPVPVRSALRPLVLAVAQLVAVLRELGRTLSRAYLEVMLLRDGSLGLLFVLGTFLRPQVGCFGVLSVLSALAFGTLIGMTRDSWKNGSYLSNPLLVGLGLGSYLSLSWGAACFVAILGAGTLVATIALAGVLQTYFRLPVLTLPFVLCLTVGYLASLRYGGLMIGPGQPLFTGESWLPLPAGVDHFLIALGATLFIPHPAAGLVFAFVLAWRSRILLLLAIGGWCVGTATRGLLLGSATATAPLTAYNFILTAMILGGVFLVPSLRSYLIALVGVVISAVLLDAVEVAGSLHGLSAYALPFNFVSLGFLYALVLFAFPGLPLIPGRTPEETLEIDLALRWRFGDSWRTLRLPFFGVWNVWQGFDGPWTHQGDYRYAYDFVITDDQGRTFTGTGLSLKDYHCYRRPVVAPVRGRVVKVIANLPDNEPGQVNSVRNWGNVVVLYDDRGFYVVLAHLARSSVRVTEGAWVEAGTIVGLCGNSGFSPQPHLHIQVQAVAEVGAASLPFSFAGYLQDGKFEARGLPVVGRNAEPLPLDLSLDSCLELLLGDELVYAVHRAGRQVAELHLRVRVALDGTLYFESNHGGRLYFGKRDGAFFFYRVEGTDLYLPLLLRALPRVPLSYREGLTWTDSLPASLLLSSPLRALVQVIGSVAPAVQHLHCRLAFGGRDVVRCQTEGRLLGLAEEAEVTFDAGKGPARVRVGSWELIRVSEARA